MVISIPPVIAVDQDFKKFIADYLRLCAARPFLNARAPMHSVKSHMLWLISVNAEIIFIKEKATAGNFSLNPVNVCIIQVLTRISLLHVPVM